MSSCGINSHLQIHNAGAYSVHATERRWFHTAVTVSSIWPLNFWCVQMGKGTRAGQPSGDGIWQLCSQLNKQQQAAGAAGEGSLSSSDMKCLFLFSRRPQCLARRLSQLLDLLLPPATRQTLVYKGELYYLSSSAMDTQLDCCVHERWSLATWNPRFHFLFKNIFRIFYSLFFWVMRAFFKLK